LYEQNSPFSFEDFRAKKMTFEHFPFKNKGAFILKRTLAAALVLFVCNLFQLISLTPDSFGAARQPTKVLITPLWFHSPEDLTFLNRGILEMLATRLPQEGRIIVLQASKAPQDDKDALMMAAKQEADYVLTGGVTLFDNNVSTDLRLLQADNGRIKLKFSRFGQKPGDVLRHIDELAGEIVSLLNQERNTAAKPSTLSPTDTQQSALTPPPAPTPQPALQGESIDPTGRRRSDPLDLVVVSLTLADITGKGKSILVIATEHQIQAFALNHPALKNIVRWQGLPYQKILSVDAGDFNQNGKAEIYVSCLDKHQHPASFVLEWQGKDFETILDKAPWFFRVLAAPGVQPRLVGQKQRLISSDSPFEMNQADPFLPGIHTLVWEQGTLKAAKPIQEPDKANALAINNGNLLQASQPSWIAFDNHDRLQIFSQDGREQWHSSQAFGGSETYLEIPTNLAGDQSGRFYLPQRLLLTDQDKNGRHELVVAQNSDSGGRLLARFRRYTQGKVTVLGWNGATMKPLWQTDPLEGYISDIALEPPDAEGNAGRLLIALVNKEKGLFGGKKTRIVEYNIYY
jgi:TolB-like protein